MRSPPRSPRSFNRVLVDRSVHGNRRGNFIERMEVLETFNTERHRLNATLAAKRETIPMLLYGTACSL
jgi:hypothetical protein